MRAKQTVLKRYPVVSSFDVIPPNWFQSLNHYGAPARLLDYSGYLTYKNHGEWELEFYT